MECIVTSVVFVDGNIGLNELLLEKVSDKLLQKLCSYGTAQR